MKRISRILSLLLALVLAFSLAACSQSGQESTESPATEAPAAMESGDATQAPDDGAESQEPEAGVTYPCADGETLSIFYPTSPMIMSFYDPAESVYWTEMEARTGVSIDWMITTDGAQQFNIMVASGDVTDLIHSVHQFYSGGMDTAVEEGTLIALNDYLETYMPDYYAVLQSNEEMLKGVTTDSGNIVLARGFYDTVFSSVYGPVIRQDWLDAVDMEAPETYEELYEVMKAFKTETGAEYGIAIPYTGVPFGNYLIAGFGVAGFDAFDKNSALTPFYQVDGEVKYGPMEDGFREYLTMVNQWYEEGLIDPDFFSFTANYTYPEETEISGEKVGIWFTQVSLMNSYDAYFDEGSTFSLTPIKDFVPEAGDITHFTYAQDLSAGLSVGISAYCENPELAAMFLNYGYTDEGWLLNNYGVEGLSFEYDADGNPQLTELVTNNPDGIPMAFAMGYYGQSNGPFIIDSTRFNVAYTDVQKSATAIWDSSTDGAYDYPYFATMTSEEYDEFSTSYADISTYVTTSILQFIIGELSIENDWDAYVETIQSLGIDTCLSLKQAACDRYAAR